MKLSELNTIQIFVLYSIKLLFGAFFAMVWYGICYLLNKILVEEWQLSEFLFGWISYGGWMSGEKYFNKIVKPEK